MINKLYIKIIIIFSFCSCFNREKKEVFLEEKNTYQILSLLIDNFSRNDLPPVAFPPSPRGGEVVYETKDSLSSYKYFYDYYYQNKIFAIVKEMYPTSSSHTFNTCTNIDNDLLQKFHSLKENKSIEIHKIAIQDKDSLIYYDKEFKKEKRKSFNKKMNLLFNFSRIAFNKEYNKAIVIIGLSKSYIAGFSAIIYLEKEHYHWKIKCEKGLTIS